MLANLVAAASHAKCILANRPPMVTAQTSTTAPTHQSTIANLRNIGGLLDVPFLSVSVLRQQFQKYAGFCKQLVRSAGVLAPRAGPASFFQVPDAGRAFRVKRMQYPVLRE
jgi:hypothetical protein